MAFLKDQGRVIHYRLLGDPSKPLLVLAHPLGMTQGVWDDMLPALLTCYRVLTWDLPGHGASAAWPGDEPATPDALAREALALVAVAAVDRFHFVGTSIGGVIGQALIAQHPQRLLSATLTNTGPRIGTPEAWQQRSALVQEKGLAAMAGEIVSRWFGAPACERQPALVEGWTIQLGRTDSESYALLCEMLGRFDYREKLANQQVKVRLVGGTADVATPPETLDALALALGNAPLTILEDVGHVPSVEDPISLTRILLS